MGRGLCVAAGLAAILLGILGLSRWWGSFIWVLKGVGPIVLLMGGVVAVIAGLMNVRE
ncbi:MAG: hypothetical protein HY594_02780 [Candidatus Omnitrophica bacterium]|nr:hypothetical protein [Candidatus Omnitrophota bacterium]